MMRFLGDFFPAEAQAYYSQRAVDFTWPEGQEDFNPTQKDHLKNFFGAGHPPVIQVRQVHGKRIISLKAGDVWDGHYPPQADGLVTDRTDFMLGVRTADCLPVFIYDPVRRVIGLIHAGWRGTAAGIFAAAFQSMRQGWGCRAADLRVAFGPSIRKCCYRVGQEFKDIFPGAVDDRPEGLHLDLVAVNRKACLACGIPAQQLRDCGVCTCCSPTFFSYRREGEKTGRHLFLFFLVPPQKGE